MYLEDLALLLLRRRGVVIFLVGVAVELFASGLAYEFSSRDRSVLIHFLQGYRLAAYPCRRRRVVSDQVVVIAEIKLGKDFTLNPVDYPLCYSASVEFGSRIVRQCAIGPPGRVRPSPLQTSVSLQLFNTSENNE